MEGFMRIGLLMVTAVILFLIVYEYRGRRRPLKLRDEEERDFMIHDESAFNLEPEPKIETAMRMSDIKPAPKKPIQVARPEDLLVLSIIAKPDQYFVSYDLIQAISGAGLQFGDMNIFHYYNPEMAGKETLFSLASATEPGDFDIDHIGDFSCSGLTLFMSISAVSNPLKVFELMLATAQQLADDLDGELRAGRKHVWNNELLQQYRNKIAAYQSYEHVT